MDITLDWLIGFVEGEGSFSYSHRNGYRIPRFSISQAGAMEELRSIRKYLGFGSVYRRPNEGADVLQVRAINQCLQLVSLFEGKIRLYKRHRQFEEWKQVCLEWKRRRVWSREQEEKAIEMLKTGASYNEIAAFTNHTAGAIETRNYQNWRIYPLGRAERTWKLEDDIQAKEMLEQGISYSNIAEELGRSYDSIKWRNLHVWGKLNTVKSRQRAGSVLAASIDNLA